mmetsp:Transcript_8208/g.17675  ORF Transcript_8208/g.17675 Transcript_8208/m.17675 type:complete len:219 (-) Transcript_8208:948-1604(-)|eukprot:CAMPEP_0185844578 /NCGR_PEP_ID=MMETSP1354-20130828/683_1 /TAXON_ID=708628 /ORGANISM="Erythrolobus madagascarensis, Strain CCMP3276" /LENGTH=218 /DNA_ID=CAMNT_0028544261 /DNA_START=48 /DNA_END=704 /DNA_ORIENTATION=+
MNDQQVNQQIEQMVAFINQEALEKQNEINVKAEEEFNIRKLTAVEAARSKISGEFEKKKKQIAINQKIERSTELNAARLRTLKAMDSELQSVVADATTSLAKVSANQAVYKPLMFKILLQACLTLCDPVVVVKVRLTDAPLVKELLPSVSGEYNKVTGKEVKLSIDGSGFLDEKSAGGAVLYSNEGRIFLDNTFESRLGIAYEQNMPVIRSMLFQNAI